MRRAKGHVQPARNMRTQVPANFGTFIWCNETLILGGNLIHRARLAILYSSVFVCSWLGGGWHRFSP